MIVRALREPDTVQLAPVAVDRMGEPFEALPGRDSDALDAAGDTPSCCRPTSSTDSRRSCGTRTRSRRPKYGQGLAESTFGRRRTPSR